MSVSPSTVQMALVTSAGQLMIRSMSGHEEVSRLFEYQVNAIAEGADLQADDYLGKAVAVSLGSDGPAPRWFHGIVASFGIEGGDGRYHGYRLTLRPWLWLLTRSANLRIFQAKSTPEIVKAVIQDYQGEVVDELKRSYAPREYCVQYRETDFNFVSRLLEEEGIFYFFRHSADKHQLVLADQSISHVVFDGHETIPFNQGDNSVVDFSGISEWRTRREIQPGKATLRDFNFLTPSTDLTAQAVSHRNHAEAAHEVYDYPGLYGAAGDGAARATLRTEEAESRHGRCTGQGNSPGLVAGCKFTLAGHRRSDQNADYVVLATQIDMQLAPYESGEGEETRFLCRFEVQPYAEPFRPARLTRKPAVAGPQTAIVVGDAGEGGVTTDEHARIKVQFHWDRLGQKDANSSCWVRVASPWAGNGWGLIALPRIGQEVVVDFLEGDPDRPLITGRVHNAMQKAPYELPDHATVATFKSRSKNGGKDEFNELRFQDDPGQEHLFMQAQKDKFERVRNTVNTEIGKDQLLTVKGGRKEKIAEEVHFSAGKDLKQKVGGKLSLKVAQNMLIATDGLHSLKAAQDITAKAGTGYSVDAGTNIHVKGGVNVTIEAGVMLTLKAGGNSVVIGPAGVSITGSPFVMINSGGSASGASPVAPTAPEDPADPEAFKDPLDGKHR